MTTLYERTNALMLTNRLLERLTDKKRTDIPQDILELATTIERHYPNPLAIQTLVEAAAQAGNTTSMFTKLIHPCDANRAQSES